MNEIVTLSPEETLSVVVAAAVQQIRSVSRGRTLDHGAQTGRTQTERWAETIRGLLGEYCVAKALGLFWTPGDIHVNPGADIDGKIEVKTTEWAGGHLFVYPHYRVDNYYVLAIGHHPEFLIPGWITGTVAKQEKWWDESRNPPCFSVPQNALLSLSELRGCLRV